MEAIGQVRLSISATLIRTVFECSGEIVISDQKLYFLGENAKSTQVFNIFFVCLKKYEMIFRRAFTVIR